MNASSMGYPGQRGLYSPAFEHDACGIGMIVDIAGRRSHKIVTQALDILCNLEHRGGAGAEPDTGDGAGILTQLALYSVNLRIMGQANRPVSSRQYELLVDQQSVRSLSLDNPILVVAIFVAAVIALLYWFFGTELGASLRATGSNPNMSRAQGINTNFTKVLGLMLSNGLVALSSALLAQYQGFADVNMGRGAIVIGLAAVIIGEVIFGKLFHNFALKLLAVVIGAILYYFVYQVVIWLGLNTDDMKLITALIVAAFLAIPYWKGKYARVKVPAGGAKAEVKTGGEQDA